jgi:hypothetical protein
LNINVVDIQKKVLQFYGFNTPERLCWNWQYTTVTTDESNDSYKKAYNKFISDSGISEEEKEK